MNLSLQDPFSVAKEFPETLTNTLNYGHSVATNSNPQGRLFSIGII